MTNRHTDHYCANCQKYLFSKRPWEDVSDKPDFCDDQCKDDFEKELALALHHSKKKKMTLKEKLAKTATDIQRKKAREEEAERKRKEAELNAELKADVPNILKRLSIELAEAAKAGRFELHFKIDSSRSNIFAFEAVKKFCEKNDLKFQDESMWRKVQWSDDTPEYDSYLCQVNISWHS